MVTVNRTRIFEELFESTSKWQLNDGPLTETFISTLQESTSESEIAFYEISSYALRTALKPCFSEMISYMIREGSIKRVDFHESKFFYKNQIICTVKILHKKLSLHRFTIGIGAGKLDVQKNDSNLVCFPNSKKPKAFRNIEHFETGFLITQELFLMRGGRLFFERFFFGKRCKIETSGHKEDRFKKHRLPLFEGLEIL